MVSAPTPNQVVFNSSLIKNAKNGVAPCAAFPEIIQNYVKIKNLSIIIKFLYTQLFNKNVLNPDLR